MKVRLNGTLSRASLKSTTSNSPCSQLRFLSSSNSTTSPSEPPAPAIPNPRWLSEVKERVGKCIMFGMPDNAFSTAAGILRAIAKDWRSLVAGREGFLVDKKRAGLLRHKIVWGEQDCMSHVNNVTYIRWAESARMGWAHNYSVHHDPEHKKEWGELWTAKSDGLILRSIQTDYKFPMTWPDHVSVFHKLRSLPKPTDSHFILDVMILSELRQRQAARCVEDIVVYDYRKGKKIPIRPFMMDAFEKTWVAQEAEKERIEHHIAGIEGNLKGLERMTWDKPGAVEDMGSVK